jgi:hypothetical protein
MNTNNQNKHYQPAIMVISVLLAVIGFSQMNTQVKVLGFQTKQIAPLADVLASAEVKSVPLPEVMISTKVKAGDSSAIYKRDVDSSNIVDFETDTTVQLAKFFKALNEAKARKRKVRIAYFGDSMIEGDLITQDVRDCFQEEFGGRGVGFVPITSIVSSFRTSVGQQFDGWSTYNLTESVPKDHVLGISGYDFVPALNNSNDSTNTKSSAWVKYNAVKTKHGSQFYSAKLLYGKSDETNYVIINGKKYKMAGTNAVNQITLDRRTPYQQINAQFFCNKPVDVFGFSIESDSGAFVDNYSFRGNSGMPLTKVPSNVYAGTNNCLKYDLIILHYGLNVVIPKVTDYSWYAGGMGITIKYIQACFPGVPILLISVGDKSDFQNGVYHTDASVPLLVKTQKQLAENNKVAFWSLYDAMGGSGSMVQWVQGNPPLANRDYTHFNFRGANRIGKLLYTKLMSEYSDYNKKQAQKLE